MKCMSKEEFEKLDINEQFEYIKYMNIEPQYSTLDYFDYECIGNNLSIYQISEFILRIINEDNYDIKLLNSYIFIIQSYYNYKKRIKDIKKYSSDIKFFGIDESCNCIIDKIKKELRKYFEDEEFINNLVDNEFRFEGIYRHINYSTLVDNVDLKDVFYAASKSPLFFNGYYGFEFKYIIEYARKMENIKLKKFPFINFDSNEYKVETLGTQDTRIFEYGYMSKYHSVLKVNADDWRNYWIKYCTSSEYGGCVVIKNKNDEVLCMLPILRNGNTLMIYTGVLLDKYYGLEYPKEYIELLVEYSNKVLSVASQSGDNLEYVTITDSNYINGYGIVPFSEFNVYRDIDDDKVIERIDMDLHSDKVSSCYYDGLHKLYRQYDKEIAKRPVIISCTGCSNDFVMAEVQKNYTDEEMNSKTKKYKL